jgi:hypothetical protein
MHQRRNDKTIGRMERSKRITPTGPKERKSQRVEWKGEHPREVFSSRPEGVLSLLPARCGVSPLRSLKRSVSSASIRPIVFSFRR